MAVSFVTLGFAVLARSQSDSAWWTDGTYGPLIAGCGLVLTVGLLVEARRDLVVFSTFAPLIFVIIGILCGAYAFHAHGPHPVAAAVAVLMVPLTVFCGWQLWRDHFGVPAGTGGAYDKVGWYLGDPEDQGFPEERAYVPGGFYLGWAVERRLCSPWLIEETGDAVPRFLRRVLSAPDLFADVCDGALVDDMFTDEGNAFARTYLAPAADYIGDFADLFGAETPWSVEGTWAQYDRYRAHLDERFAEWRAARAT